MTDAKKIAMLEEEVVSRIIGSLHSLTETLRESHEAEREQLVYIGELIQEIAKNTGAMARDIKTIREEVEL